MPSLQKLPSWNVLCHDYPWFWPLCPGSLPMWVRWPPFSWPPHSASLSKDVILMGFLLNLPVRAENFQMRGSSFDLAKGLLFSTGTQENDVYSDSIYKHAHHAIPIWFHSNACSKLLFSMRTFSTCSTLFPSPNPATSFSKNRSHWGSRGPHSRAVVMGEPRDWWTSSYRLGLQSTRPGCHEQGLIWLGARTAVRCSYF